jgi:transcriptional regulator with XRE-family HTH domain
MPPVDTVRVGRSLRALRIKRRLRQLDVAAKAGLSRSKVSRIESGDWSRIPAGDVAAAAAALGATPDVRVRWHAEDLDRLLDSDHAAVVDHLVRQVTTWGWQCLVEVSFNVAGERGSVDILARHPSTPAVLLVEVKSVIPDVQAMLASHDRKVRVGAAIAARLGWKARSVARLLVVGDTTTARRRVTDHEAIFATAYPARGSAVRRWLREPEGRIDGLLFLPFAHG